MLLVLFAVSADALPAQEPVLRVMETAVRGALIDGAAAYPVTALEALGFHVSTEPSGVVAVLGTDTLRFWATSPFFQRGGQMQHLAFPAHEIAGTVYLPEQFFIQWLPNSYPERYAFQGGAVVSRGGAVRTVARGQAADPAPASAAPATAAATPPTARPAAATPSTAAPPVTSPTAAPERRIVVIDPGHGGRDPGKIGPGGLRESDVVLTVSRGLAAVLEDRGYEVHLTRSTDVYVQRDDRARLANQWKGSAVSAVFLSIHANSASATSARGFETFFLSEARTDDERRVAEMENEAFHLDEHPPVAADGGLDLVLSTLHSDFLMRASHDLAAVVQNQLSMFHPGPNRGVKRAGFDVLVGSIMPSVLIELAFISNPDEARLLGSAAFQDRLAKGIADSVDEFFQRNEHLWTATR